MAKLFGVVLTITLLAFATLAQADSDQPRPVSEGPDFSSLETGALIDRRIDWFSMKFIEELRKYNPKRADKIESQIRRKSTSIDQVTQMYKHFIEASEKLDQVEKVYKEGYAKEKVLFEAKKELSSVVKLMDNARYFYLEDVRKTLQDGKKFRRTKNKFKFKLHEWTEKFAKLREKNDWIWVCPKGR